MNYYKDMLLRYSESGKKTDFYDTCFINYIEADEQTRAASRQHYLNRHKENLASGREDLIIFTARILAAYSLADEILETISA